MVSNTRDSSQTSDSSALQMQRVVHPDSTADQVAGQAIAPIMPGVRAGGSTAMDMEHTVTSTTRSRRSRAGDDSNSAQTVTSSGGEPLPTDTTKQAEGLQQGWWRRTWASMRSIELENNASVARDHLALERTFLAWLRTSLAFASIGVAITQLFRLNTTISDSDPLNEHSIRALGKPLGGVFLGISILTLFLGYHRYNQAQRWIIKGKFPASRGTILIVSLVSVALMIVSLVVVAVVQPNS